MELTKQIGVLRNRKTLDGRKADRNKVNLEYWNFNENLGDLLSLNVLSVPSARVMVVLPMWDG